METKLGYPIRYAVSASGVKAHVIRTWERRYKAITPRRTATNRRIYSDSDIRRLRLLKAAVNAGHSISQIARLDTESINGLVKRSRFLVKAPRTRKSDLPAEVPAVIEEALNAVIVLDGKRLEQVLEQAAIAFTRPVLLQDVIMPLFAQIGEYWKAGRVKIIGEHMATIVARSILWDMLRTVDISDSAPKIVLATPAGHWHELGVLVAALIAAEAGWMPQYFGPNLPAEEIAAAVSHTGAKAVALGIAHCIDDNRLARELKKTRRYIGVRIAFFVGGRGVQNIGTILEQNGLKCIVSLRDFRNDLDRLATSDFKPTKDSG